MLLSPFLMVVYIYRLREVDLSVGMPNFVMIWCAPAHLCNAKHV